MTWHPPIEPYLRGELSPVQAMAVDAHLAACEKCRNAVPYAEDWLARSWAGIEELVDRPRLRPVTRLLRAAGVPEHVAVFLAATPALARGWLVAVGLVSTFAVLAARLTESPDALLFFLVLAPVLPLSGIALAYGPRVDPVYETQAATPMAGSRALLLRAVAVLIAALVLTGAATPFLPSMAAAWLLPALVLALASLALSARLAPLMSAGLLAAGWFGAAALWSELTGDKLAGFSTFAQILYGTAAVILIPLVHLRFSGEPR
ncbi:zf-HC2 domain-containing protein [Nonomuraea sp. NPDC050663]|uniref:zf-HC2 domain-containing protein n=1 Tax=Nonomuraea sp. NPDC050663 TaxID=3364370 RepID=UPI00378EFC7B